MKFPNSDFFENPWAGFRGPGSARFAQSFVASPAVIAVGCRMVVGIVFASAPVPRLLRDQA